MNIETTRRSALYTCVIAALTGLLILAFTAPASAIMRRHDVDDAQYLVAAEIYPACFDLIESGDGVGTLIRPDWLITAAHVAKVLVDERRTQIPGPNGPLGIARIVIHPQWADDTDDVALIQLTQPVRGVRPIALYEDTDEVGQEVIFVGRGDIGTGLTGETPTDRRLRAATNTIIDADAHWISFRFNRPGEEGVTELEGISGSGDSGGPAFIRQGEALVIAGISSYQDEGNHRLGQYGVEEFYARVSSYRSWIEGVVGTSGHAAPADDEEEYSGAGGADGESEAPDDDDDPVANDGADNELDEEPFADATDEDAAPTMDEADTMGCDATSASAANAPIALGLLCLLGLGRRRLGR